MSERIPTPVLERPGTVQTYRSVPATRPEANVIVCSGCQQPIAAPLRPQRLYRCPSCGHLMNIVGLQPAVALATAAGLWR